jgi:hypothetical protein
MGLSGIVLAVLIILVGLGTAAGMLILVTGRDREQEAPDSQSHWWEGEDLNLELPPPENAWKPATWYSEVADGTLFPNQPSTSFRILADSSFQRAISRRDLEDRAANEPTRPHASLPNSPLPPTGPHLPKEPTMPPIPDELEALTQIPTVSMRIVPVKDNLPPTRKMRSMRPGHSTSPLAEQDALLHHIDTVETAELVKNWPGQSSEPFTGDETPEVAELAPSPEDGGSPAPVETRDQFDDRLEIEAYAEVIHLGYYADLDAISISFAGCSIRKSSDVPLVFQSISQKLEQVLAPQEWHQRALLLDVAGLEVADEAEIAWDMLLDGFVSQYCPEVTLSQALAVQYDSSQLPQDHLTDEGMATQEMLQQMGPGGGQLRSLARAQSFDEAVGMLQHMRAGM